MFFFSLKILLKVINITIYFKIFSNFLVIIKQKKRPRRDALSVRIFYDQEQLFDSDFLSGIDKVFIFDIVKFDKLVHRRIELICDLG